MLNPVLPLQFQCLQPNAEPLVLERVPTDTEARQGGPAAWIHTKASKLACQQMLLLLLCFVACACNGAWIRAKVTRLQAGLVLLVCGAEA